MVASVIIYDHKNLESKLMAVVVSNESHLFFSPLAHKNTVRLCRLADKKNGSKAKTWRGSGCTTVYSGVFVECNKPSIMTFACVYVVENQGQ